MSSIKDFRVHGPCSAVVTPFKSDGDLNLSVIKPYVKHLVDYGIKSLFVNGTNGEGVSMTVEERKLTAKTWQEAAKGNFTIVLHIGAGNLRDSKELARHAGEIGIDAIACVGPTFFKPERMEDYVEYMREIAAAAPNTPFYLYDIDFFTGIKLEVDEFLRSARGVIPTLRGVKHTSPNFPSMHRTHTGHDGAFQIMVGLDNVYLEALSIGIDVPVMSSYLGNVLTRLRDAFLAGDIDVARKEQKRVLLFENIHRKHNVSGVRGTKTVLRALGLDVGQPRLPVSPISDEIVAAYRKDLEDIGFFQWGSSLGTTILNPDTQCDRDDNLFSSH